MSFAGNNVVAYSQLMLDNLQPKRHVAVAIEDAAASGVTIFGSFITWVVIEKDIECGVL